MRRAQQKNLLSHKDRFGWLGLDYDETFKQSDRFGKYEAAFDDLKARGLVYACYETPDELERKRKRQLARGMPPVYDRAALELTDEQIAAHEAEGRAPHYRFKLSGNAIVWNDMVRGDRKSKPPACPIRSFAAPMAHGSTLCPAWLTILTPISLTSFAVKIMSPIQGRKLKSLKRWAALCRYSRISRSCWPPMVGLYQNA